MTTDDDDLPAERLSIDQLAVLGGVTPRTIRYYIALGLLDKPMGEKRGAYYVRRHVEQVLLVRRWVDAGVSLERARDLLAGAPGDPRPKPPKRGSVQVWSHITLVDGLEVHVEPGRANLSPEQVRAFVRAVTAAYRSVRDSRACAE